MFDKIDKKLKLVANICFLLTIAVAIVIAFVFINETNGISLALILIGPLVAWLTSCTLYAFGELVDKVCDIERNTRNGNAPQGNQLADEKSIARKKELDALYAQGLITEEEYKNSMAKV